MRAEYKSVDIPANETKERKEKLAEQRLGKISWSFGPAVCKEGKDWVEATTAGPDQVKPGSGSLEASND